MTRHQDPPVGVHPYLSTTVGPSEQEYRQIERDKAANYVLTRAAEDHPNDREAQIADAQLLLAALGIDPEKIGTRTEPRTHTVKSTPRRRFV
jgi:hypothetical protein